MSRTLRLWVVLALNLVLVGALVVIGLSAHSLGVLAEGADYLADAAGIAVSLLAIWLAGRPATLTRSHGHPTATTWAAAVNAGWLLLLNLLVVAGALARLAHGTRHVDGLPVVVVSGIAAGVMLVGALILSGNIDDDHDGDDGDAVSGDDLNLKAILLDTAADAAAAAGVAVAGAVILATGSWYWLDPTVALAIALVVSYHAFALLRRVNALRELGLAGSAQ